MGGVSHEHQWKRWPVTSFTVVYGCDCGDRHRWRWCDLVPSVSHVDTQVMGTYGGTVSGDAHQSWEFTLSHRMQQMAELGLTLYPEGPAQDEDEP